MALTSEATNRLVKEYQQSSTDTGSCEVQVAILSADIGLLTQHIKQHRHDQHSEHGLLQKVSKRNRLLRYLKRRERSRYQILIQRLGLRDKA